jgi:hypothetical protein
MRQLHPERDEGNCAAAPKIVNFSMSLDAKPFEAGARHDMIAEPKRSPLLRILILRNLSFFGS